MMRTSRIACRVTLGLCPALLLLAGCKKKEAGEGEGEAKAVVAAKTAMASVEPFTHTISAIGSVVARPDRYAALSAPAPTRITRVHVAAGQRVAAGAPSLRLRRAALKMAGEYEWRAQCVEDALRFQGVLTRDRAVVPSQHCA